MSDNNLAEQLESYDKKNMNKVLGELEIFKKKVEKITWQQLHTHKGFNSELLVHRKESDKPMCSIRISRKTRALYYRDDRYMVLISIHPDHDSAYK